MTAVVFRSPYSPYALRGNLHFHFNQGNPEIEYFNCSNYKGNRGICSSTHYIRADFLEQIVLAEITRLTRFVCHYEKEFAKLMMGFTQQSECYSSSGDTPHSFKASSNETKSPRSGSFK